MFVLVMFTTAFVCIIALNPDFWKGYRNSKFIDEMIEEERAVRKEREKEKTEIQKKED